MEVILMQGDIMVMAIVSNPTFIEPFKNTDETHLNMRFYLRT